MMTGPKRKRGTKPVLPSGRMLVETTSSRLRANEQREGVPKGGWRERARDRLGRLILDCMARSLAKSIDHQFERD